MRRSSFPATAVFGAALACLVIGAAACSNDATTETGASSTTAASGGNPSESDAGGGETTTTTAPPATTKPDPGSLPQTEDEPTADSEQLQANAELLFDAIVADDPEIAQPFFFPLGAYEQVKDISDPAGDYEDRLMTQYAGDIHTYHQQLGSSAQDATFVELRVPEYNAVWVNPGVEYNQLGYWRVFDSSLVYELDGVEQSFNVKSMISWRGEWYVVHLIAIK